MRLFVLSTVLLSTVLLSLCAQVRQCHAQPQSDETSSTSNKAIDDKAIEEKLTRVVPGYCGLYCLHAAAESLGKKVDFEKLLVPKYLGSEEGSSVAELLQATIDLGLHAKVMRNFTCGGLELLTEPAILHVRQKPSSKKYDHWILVMGVTDGEVRIFDGSNKTVSMSELAACWDGLAILVSDRPINTSAYFLQSLATSIFMVGGIVLFWFLLSPTRFSKVLSIAPESLPSRIPEGLLVYGLATVFLIGLHSLVNSGGYLNDAKAIAGVQERHIADIKESIDVVELQRLMETDNLLLVDARLKRDFDHGHIPGAIHFPANRTATIERVYEEFDHLPRSTCVVLYCQSAGCNFDEYVARLFQAVGFNNIKFYTEGWRGWEQHTNRQKS